MAKRGADRDLNKDNASDEENVDDVSVFSFALRLADVKQPGQRDTPLAPIGGRQ